MVPASPRDDRAARILPALPWRGRLLGLIAGGVLAGLVAVAIEALAVAGA